MELLVTLHKMENLKEISKLDIQGVIFGSLFAHGYKLSLEDMVEVNNMCLKYNLKRYVSMNSLIDEDGLKKLDAYMDLLKELDVDGIYFSDFAILNKAYAKDMQKKLIYDPYNLNTNQKDVGFFAEYNIPCVLAREITLDEVVDIIKIHPFMCDMQIFGHLRMSESKRKYISNYFRNFNINENPEGKETYRLKEENRDYRMPIMEDEYGTCVYTDYVFAMFSELEKVSKYINHAIIDDLFLDSEVINEYIRNLPKIDNSTVEVIKESMEAKYPELTLSNGYLFQKTTDVKVKNE